MAVEEGKILRLVLSEMAKEGFRYAPVGISVRHVHLSEKDLHALFGAGYSLHPLRDLVQPGQYAAQEQVTLIGPKGTLEKVRIIGPLRSETQVELSLTDAAKIGLKDLPIRMSGHLDGTPGIRILGPSGDVQLSGGVIAAARHLHLSEEQAKAFRVHDGQAVSVRIAGERPCLLERVICRTGKGHELELHLDTDEANACALKSGDIAEVLPFGEGALEQALEETFDPARIYEKVLRSLTGNAGCRLDKESLYTVRPVTAAGEELLELVTESDINIAADKGKNEVFCTLKALITPSASDRSRERGVKIIRASQADSFVGVISAGSAGSLAGNAAADSEILELVTAGDLNLAFRDDRKEIFCTKNALITPAAKERIAETGIRVVRVG